MTIRRFHRRRSSRTALRVLLAGLLAAVLVACSGTTGAVQLGASCADFEASKAITQAAEARVGDELSIVLCSNPSTGFSWEEPVIADPAILTVTGSTYREPGTELPIVGAAGGQEIRVTAAAVGTTTLSVAYSRPWEGGEKAVQTYEVTITVK